MDKKYRTIKGMNYGGLAARAADAGNALRLWLGSRRNRIFVAILAGMLAASGVSGDLSALSRREPSPSLTAWWGSLYPKFCYAETSEHETPSSHPIKLSFRLAELFK